MTLNVIKIDGSGDSLRLIQIAQIRKEIRIVSDLPNIAFEMPMIDRVKADKGHEKSQVCFQERIAKGIAASEAEPLNG